MLCHIRANAESAKRLDSHNPREARNGNYRRPWAPQSAPITLILCIFRTFFTRRACGPAPPPANMRNNDANYFSSGGTYVCANGQGRYFVKARRRVRPSWRYLWVKRTKRGLELEEKTSMTCLLAPQAPSPSSSHKVRSSQGLWQARYVGGW